LTEIQDHFSTTQEIWQHQPEAKPACLIVMPPIQKYLTGQLILFNKNGRILNLKPHWTGPHKFTNNKETEHTEILLQPGYCQNFSPSK
jgi:hypothetical protein